MKYKLKIPDMIPKGYAHMIDDLENEEKPPSEIVCVRITGEKAFVDFKDRKARYEIPKDWLVEVKESPFQKWNKEFKGFSIDGVPVPYSQYDLAHRIAGWNAAIGCLYKHFQDRFDPTRPGWKEEILQFKEE